MSKSRSQYSDRLQAEQPGLDSQQEQYFSLLLAAFIGEIITPLGSDIFW